MSSEDQTSDDASRTPYEDRQLAQLAALLKEATHPKQIGPYRIIEVVGEGGMGVVYRAEQDQPIQRTVAIKVIKLGMDTHAVLERFESERRALAVLDHPNVARVLDAGTTETGRPYFVMEFVAGTSITTFADDHRLSVTDRLALISQACEAVQHAHQKAIIHRDLKPSNILVAERDGVPVVKVIDFGVAKAIDKGATEQMMFTEVGQLVGTPEYMSPEQADGSKDIDTRSDVYSLGVVLYELLSGALPFDSKTLRRAGYGEVCRIIREVDPPRPSAKLISLGEKTTAIANDRRSSPALLARQLRSELDWIVIKSLRKERETRYASPLELLEDIQNYLANRPLRAGPESPAYRAKKFVRRNKSAVIAVSTALTLLLAGVAATAWQAIRATRAERATRVEQTRTIQERNNAQAANTATSKVNDFLIDMLASVDPENAQGKPVLVRDVIDHAAADVGVRFKGQPKIEAEVRSTLGATYAGLGLFTKADEHLGASWHLYEALSGATSREALRAKQRVASLRLAQDKLDEAFTMTNGVLIESRQHFGNDDPLTLDATVELAAVCDRRGDPAEEERLLRDALSTYERTGASDTEPYYTALGNLGQLMRPLGRLDEAEPLCRKALDGMVRLKGPDSPTAIDMLGTYADVLRLRGQLPEAEKIMTEYAERATRVFGPDNARSINPEEGLAVVLDSEGKTDEAMVHYENAIGRLRKVLGNDHGDTLFELMTFASSRSNHGDHEQAERLFRESHDGWVRSVGPDHPNAVYAQFGVVHEYLVTARWDAAVGPAKELFEQLQDPKRVQIPPARRARYLAVYGVALAHLSRNEEAVAPLLLAYAALIANDTRSSGNIEAYWSVTESLAKVAERQGDNAKADYWRNEHVRFGPATAPAQPTSRAST